MLMRLCLAQAFFDPGFNELSPPQPGAWARRVSSFPRCSWEGKAAEGFGLSAHHGSQTVIGIPEYFESWHGSPQGAITIGPPE